MEVGANLRAVITAAADPVQRRCIPAKATIQQRTQAGPGLGHPRLSHIIRPTQRATRPARNPRHSSGVTKLRPGQERSSQTAARQLLSPHSTALRWESFTLSSRGGKMKTTRVSGEGRRGVKVLRMRGERSRRRERKEVPSLTDWSSANRRRQNQNSNPVALARVGVGEPGSGGGGRKPPGRSSTLRVRVAPPSPTR